MPMTGEISLRGLVLLCSRNRLALAVVDLALGLLADLLGQPQHLNAVGEHRRHPVEPALVMSRSWRSASAGPRVTDCTAFTSSA
jgi:hypothetical protein